jgi:hypothetical protein
MNHAEVDAVCTVCGDRFIVVNALTDITCSYQCEQDLEDFADYCEEGTAVEWLDFAL